MNQREERIETYASDLREKCGVEPDMDLLTKITVSLGPSIYDADAGIVSATDPDEVDRVKTNFLKGKLSIDSDAEIDAALDQAFATYGRSNRQKHRAVLYYLLVKHFGKEAVFA
jgi:hypothetical protein